MDVKSMLSTLHPLERAIIPHLSKCKNQKELVKASGMQEVEVVRAMQWLDNKGIIKSRPVTEEKIQLGKNGQLYLKKGLPEIRFLKTVSLKPIAMAEAGEQAGLDKAEGNACLGILRKNNAIILDHGMISITDTGKKILLGKYEPQTLLSTIEKPRTVSSLNPQERNIMADLRARKDVIEVIFDKNLTYSITPEGLTIVNTKISAADIIDRLTPEHLARGSWKGKSVRRYDVSANVPRVFAGRKHHYKSFLDFVRQKFASLGFVEMHGPFVENDFWDMDALFMPQFHSARQIHQAYYIKEPAAIKVDPKLVAAVKACHEHGGSTGSRGWQYKFDEKRTLRTLLRTQGTACSARMLASKDLKIPGKYFGITKNARYDVIDATHLADFFQTEGIVVEEGLNFGHLKGILKMFAEEFAETDTIKLKPGYFPFTEPSVELHAKHPQLGWIELGGAGMFRPELLEPFGVKVPVIAWGIGIDRVAMLRLGIKDIRDLYSHDLDVLRKARMP